MATLGVAKLTNFNYSVQAYDLHLAANKILLKERRAGTEGSLKGFVASEYNEKFLYLKLYKEYKRQAKTFNGDPNELQESYYADGDYMSLIIDDKGCFIYEYSRFFNPDDIKSMVMDLLTKSKHENVKIQDITKFELATMRAFYKSAKSVKYLRVKSVGKVEPNPRMPPEDVEEAVQDMGTQTSSISFNSGKQQNIKDSQVINEGLARRSDIIQVKGVDEDRASFVVSKNGRIRTSLPHENESIGRKLYKICEKIMNTLH